MKSRKFLYWAVAALALAAVVPTALRLIEPVATVAAAKRGTALDAVPATVSVRADYTMDLRSEAGGRVKTSALELGHAVKTGELLLQIDDADLRIDLELATNDYDAALGLQKIGTATRLNLENARADLANFTKLADAGQYSTVDLDRRKTGVRQIEQQLQTEQLQEVANIARLAAYIKTKNLLIDKTKVVSPIDGDVVAVFAHVGDLIAVGAPLASILARARVVEASVSEENFAGIAVGQRVTVKFLSYPNEQFPGKVSRVLPSADPLTQRYTVLLDVVIPPERLVPGLSGEASIIVGQHPGALIIPRRALLGEYVLVVKNGRVEQRRVEGGYRSLQDVEILKGLAEGDVVITDNLDTFRQGDSVRVAKP